MDSFIEKTELSEQREDARAILALEHHADFQIRYNLSSEEMEHGIKELIEIATNIHGPEEDVFTVWVSWNHPLSNVVRTAEASRIPEMPEVMEGNEHRSLFLATIDTRDGQKELARGFRISGAGFDMDSYDTSEMPKITNDSTGFALIDDIISSGQEFTIDDYYSYCEKTGIDTSRCICVESNFKVDEEKRFEPYNGLPLSQIGYVALFQLVENRGADGAAVFTTLNKDAIASLDFLGVEYSPFANRNLKTPTVLDGVKGFDEQYTPVTIPSVPQNLELFRGLLNFAAPDIRI